MRRIAILLLVLLSSCSSGPPLTFVDSDVPLPPEMDVRFSSDIERDSGTLTRGRFLLSGDVQNMTKTVTDTVARYSENGWHEVERFTQPERATITFAKDERTVRVEIDRRRIDPEMSTAVVRVQRTAAATDRSSP